MKTFRVRLEILSPLHVGTGEVYQPTEFFVHPEGYLGVMDFEKFIAYFDERAFQAFKHLCQAGTVESLVKLYLLVDGLAKKFLRQGRDDFVRRRIPVSRGFLSHYQELGSLLEDPRKLKNEFKKFTIQRTALSPNEEIPIIPGSAVKGALRTAVLNLRREKVKGRSWQNYCERRCDSRRLEADILGYQQKRFQDDPFRLVKVSDFRPAGRAQTLIVYAVNRKKAGGGASGPPQILEVVEPGALFEGSITIMESEKDGGITFEEIFRALEVFYGKEAEREFEILRRLGAEPPVFPPRAYPLRLGRHSGAECVTVEGFRHILVRGPGGRKTYKDHATTLWLASESRKPQDSSSLKPFGWVALHAVKGEGERASSETPPPDLTRLGKRFKLVIKKEK